MKRKLSITAGLLLSVLCAADGMGAPIIYPSKGKENSTKYVFTAEESGELKVYFAGSGGKYDCEIGVLINGEDTGIYGLDNHDSDVGDVVDFGEVEEGDVITFVMVNHSLNDMKVYSNSTKNKKYDSPHKSVNHIYSKEYAVNKSFSADIPDGTFVGFEDKRYKSKPDWDYNDTQVVFNISTIIPGPPVPEPSAALIGTLVPMFLGSRLMRRRNKA
jgi:hypothetical protein